jgi:tRNA threonylcarbamoyladenosine biosynthesis protein TsaB
MRILGIESSTSICSVALGGADVLDECIEEAPREHHALILPMVATLLSRNNVSLDDIDAIAFGCGPGSFTGLRIAAAISQGLAFAAALPVVPVSSLDALAADVDEILGAQSVADRILVAVDAHMGEIYWGLYRRSDTGMERLRSDELSRVEGFDAAALSPVSRTVCAGDAWRIYPQIVVAGTHVVAARTRARHVVRLATRVDRASWRRAEDAEPSYVRGVSVWKKAGEQPALR